MALAAPDVSDSANPTPPVASAACRPSANTPLATPQLSASADRTALVTLLLGSLRIRPNPWPVRPPLLVGLRPIRLQVLGSLRLMSNPRPLWPTLFSSIQPIRPQLPRSSQLRPTLRPSRSLSLSAMDLYGPSSLAAFGFVGIHGPCSPSYLAAFGFERLYGSCGLCERHTAPYSHHQGLLLSPPMTILYTTKILILTSM